MSILGKLKSSNQKKSSAKISGACCPRLIKEYLDELELVPDPTEYQKLNELDKTNHRNLFDQSEAKSWTESTAEENMNR